MKKLHLAQRNETKKQILKIVLKEKDDKLNSKVKKSNNSEKIKKFENKDNKTDKSVR